MNLNFELLQYYQYKRVIKKKQRKKKLSQIFHLHHRLLRYENIFFYFTTQ